MQRSADAPTAAAVDLAEFLVVGGMPFRDAHGVVGRLVRQSLEDGADLADLVRAEPVLGPEAAALLEPGVAVTRRTTPGGAGPAAVADQLARFRDRLAQERFWLTSLT
jgi:argininosuccinate lyase